MTRPKSKAPNTFLWIFGIAAVLGIAALWVVSRTPRPQTPPTTIQTAQGAPEATGSASTTAERPPRREPVDAPDRGPGALIVTWNIEWFPGQPGCDSRRGPYAYGSRSAGGQRDRCRNLSDLMRRVKAENRASKALTHKLQNTKDLLTKLKDLAA